MDGQSKSNTAPNLPNSEAAQAPRAHWRVILCRVLKYGLLAFLFVASCVTTVALSVGASKEHSITAWYGGSNVLLLASRNGQTWFGHFSCTTPGLPNTPLPVGIEFHTEERRNGSDELIFPRLTKFGAGIVRKMHIFGSFNTVPPRSNGVLLTKIPVAVATLEGFGIILPHWTLLFILVSLFMFIAMGRRFTLRALMIWVTIVCVILAISIKASDKPDSRQVEAVKVRSQ